MIDLRHAVLYPLTAVAMARRRGIGIYKRGFFQRTSDSLYISRSLVNLRLQWLKILTAVKSVKSGVEAGVNTPYLLISAILLIKNASVHPCSVALHPCSVALHPCSVALHPCSVALHPCSVALHPCSVALHPCSVALHPCSVALHPCSVALHVCSVVHCIPAASHCMSACIAVLHSDALCAHNATVVDSFCSTFCST